MDKLTDATVSAAMLREWIENGEPVFVLDVRPLSQRKEWQIPDSHHLDAYDRLNSADDSVMDEIDIPQNTKVVTVCAAGKTSFRAMEILRQKGIEAFSLEGGMKAWSTAWNVAGMRFYEFDIIQIRRTGKGCLSYIIVSNGEAAIIDASLPTEVYVQLVKQHNLTVKYVFDTHIHADHLSRAKSLADQFNAPLYLPVPNKVEFAFNKIETGSGFQIGTITLRALPTPGHTPESVSFYIKDRIVFTGDTLFTDGVGRPDLKADIDETRRKAGLLFHSLKKLVALPDPVLILPAHTSKPVPFDGKMIYTTIENARRRIRLLQADEEGFIDFLLQHLPPTPANYLSIVEKNISGNFNDINPVDLEAGANRCAIS
jgi:glyoxylase-like metal-dependent hydrolase (beta-lactamase superfamily II)/rhodanese-related sulfurtransferase